MIPLHKLAKLPLPLKLRKIIKFFGEIEHRIRAGMAVSQTETGYLTELLRFLPQDAPISAETVREVAAALADSDRANLLRGLNALRHILLAETGQSPADWDFIDAEGALDPRKRRSFPGMRVYLEDIRSPFNVGSMFRTAESFGAEKLFLSPFCADPNHPRAARTAMGCEAVLPWERLSGDAVEELGCPLFALETGGTPLRDFQFPLTGIMIVGSEELGVSPHALNAADASLGRVSIPIYGAKGSLNASVAFGIAMQAWTETLLK
jgi:TrmH family RNA methyltransferase